MASSSSARSPVYPVPQLMRRARAAGVLIRGNSGKIEETIVAAGETAKEIERIAVEVARDEGIPQTDRNILIVEVRS